MHQCWSHEYHSLLDPVNRVSIIRGGHFFLFVHEINLSWTGGVFMRVEGDSVMVTMELASTLLAWERVW